MEKRTLIRWCSMACTFGLRFMGSQICNVMRVIVDQLARRIGRVKEVQLPPRLFYEGDYVRVRARVRVAKLLPDSHR